MHSIRNTFLSCSFLFFLACLNVNGQTESSDEVIMIRVSETLALGPARIHVFNTSGLIEEIKMKPLASQPGRTENGATIAKLISEYLNQGYVIISSTSGGTDAVQHTDYLLRRE